MKQVELLTVNKASLRLGMDPRFLRNAVKEGKVKAVQPGKRALYVTWEDVTAWLETIQSNDN